LAATIFTFFSSTRCLRSFDFRVRLAATILALASTTHSTNSSYQGAIHAIS
jgi:hypothetical protein